MSKTLTLILIPLLGFSIHSNSQTIQLVDSTAVVEKAKYIGGDLIKTIAEKVRYPIEAMQAGISGDVVFSFTITTSGKMTNTELVSSPDKLLTVSSLFALSGVKGDWSPYRLNSVPMDQKYLMVFTYRIYMNGPPPDNRNQIKRNLEKKKYEQALKLYNMEIKDKSYDYKLFESRSKVKELMGDIDGSKIDLRKSQKLKAEVMEVIYITGGMTVRRQEIGPSTTIQRRY